MRWMKPSCAISRSKRSTFIAASLNTESSASGWPRSSVCQCASRPSTRKWISVCLRAFGKMWMSETPMRTPSTSTASTRLMSDDCAISASSASSSTSDFSPLSNVTPKSKSGPVSSWMRSRNSLRLGNAMSMMPLTTEPGA